MSATLEKANNQSDLRSDTDSVWRERVYLHKLVLQRRALKDDRSLADDAITITTRIHPEYP